MGKKKIVQQTTEEALKEKEILEAALSKSGSSKASSKKIERGRAYIKASYNNTMITLTDDKGSVLAWSSAGSLGFSGPKKATPFAASKVVTALAEKIKKSVPFDIDVFVFQIPFHSQIVRALLQCSFQRSVQIQISFHLEFGLVRRNNFF